MKLKPFFFLDFFWVFIFFVGFWDTECQGSAERFFGCFGTRFNRQTFQIVQGCATGPTAQFMAVFPTQNQRRFRAAITTGGNFLCDHVYLFPCRPSQIFR